MQFTFHRPYQIRIGSFTDHVDDYAAALDEFNTAATGYAKDTQVTLWQRSEDRHEWLLVSLANPNPERPWLRPEQHRWVNHFAGLTLSPLFHLTYDTRAQLLDLGWPAPDDAVSWKPAELAGA